MRLVYIYHSGFALEADGFSILIDYFKDSDPDPAKGYVRSELLKRAGTLYILASHFHPDHFHPEVLKWKEQKPDIKYIFSKDILKRRRAKADDAIYLKKGDAYQDELLTIKAFGHVPGRSSFGYRFHEGRPAIYRSYKNKRICPDALLGTSGGGYGFRPLRRIERMSLYRIVCSGRRDGYIIYY